MKQIFSNGLRLEVRDISEPLMVLELKEDRIPLPIITKEIMTDEEARNILKDLLETQRYRRIK